jgi:hypothetical protein
VVAEKIKNVKDKVRRLFTIHTNPMNHNTTMNDGKCKYLKEIGPAMNALRITALMI